MAPPPAMKSRGMSFAEKQLQRHGWTEGKGLGRRENGISEAIKVKVKCDTAGVGHDSAEQFTFHWWDHVFNKTASSIAVETDQDGVQVKKVSEGDDETVTNKKPRKAHAHRDMLYGRFIKSATLLSGGEKPVEKEDSSSSESSDGSGDEDEKLDLSSATKLTDEDLVKICGGRTAHKGARHGLTMSAKLLRIEEQERAFLEKYGKKKPKNDANKSNGRHTEDERMEMPCSQEEIDGATPDSASDSTGTKKKKMKSSTDEDGPSKKKCPRDDVEFLDDVNGLDSCEEGTKTKVAVKETSTVQFTEELKCSKKKKKKKAADEEDIVMTNDLEDASGEDNPRRKKKRKRKDNEDHHVPPEEEAQKTSKKRKDNDEERKKELSNSYQEHVPPGEEAQKHSKKKKKRKDNEQERMDEFSNGCQEHVPPGEEAQKHSKKKKKRKDNDQERMDELSNGYQEHVPPGEEAQKSSKKKKKKKGSEDERMEEPSNGFFPPEEQAQIPSKKKKKQKSVHFSDAGEHEPKEATEEREWSENMYREEEDCKDLKKKKKSKSKHSNHPL